MVDVSQWRASIGLWHYCQAASSRPANGRQCHSFKGAIDSKSKKTIKLPAAIPIIALLLLFISFSLHMMKLNSIPPTGTVKAVLQYLALRLEVNVNVRANARIELGSILAFVVRVH